MTERINIILAIRGLCELFALHTEDRATLLSKEPAPFDADSPYWIVPNAIGFARRVGIDDAEIVRIIAG